MQEKQMAPHLDAMNAIFFFFNFIKLILKSNKDKCQLSFLPSPVNDLANFSNKQLWMQKLSKNILDITRRLA